MLVTERKSACGVSEHIYSGYTIQSEKDTFPGAKIYENKDLDIPNYVNMVAPRKMYKHQNMNVYS